MHVEFQYELGGLARQARARLVCGTQQAEIPLQHPADRLDNLAEIAVELVAVSGGGRAEGDLDARLFWEGEPWQYRWEFIRRNWRDLTIDLYYSPDRHAARNARHDPTNEERVFQCRCETAAFVRAVVDELERTLVRFGFVGFRSSRNYGDFPISRYFRLQHWLRAAPTGSAASAGRTYGESSLMDEVAGLTALLDRQSDARTAAKLTDRPEDVEAAPPTDDSRSRADFAVEYHLLEYGWAKARVRAAGQEVAFRPSYMSDAIWELSRAALRLLLPDEPLLPHEQSCPEIRWEGEPQRLRWQFTRLSPDEVEVAIHYSPDAICGDHDSWGNPVVEEMVLRTRCSVRHFARQVLDQMEQVLLKHGLVGYRESWIESEFPVSDYLRLRRLLAVRPPGGEPESVPWGLAEEVQILRDLVGRRIP